MARILKFIAVDAESKVVIAEKEGMITELLKSIAPDKDAALRRIAIKPRSANRREREIFFLVK